MSKEMRIPKRSFASDNFAGVHPLVFAALEEANNGHSMAYGDDPITTEACERFRELFGQDTQTFFVFGGTGGNIVALSTLCGPGDSVVCSQWSHLHVDETAAPERAGIKLHVVPSVDAKIQPEQIVSAAGNLGVMHHAQPRVVSITQPTELGTLYSPHEIKELCRVAHEHGMLVHMDGARIANATAALGGKDVLRSFTVDAGVDVLTFGGTKNGLMYGEAVLYLTHSHPLDAICRESLARSCRYAPYARKQSTQLPSKMRFVSAQFNAVLTDSLWLELGARANSGADQLFAAVSDLPSLELVSPPPVNSLYPIVKPKDATSLREISFFWDWETTIHKVRWMTSWDTTEADVQDFATAVRSTIRHIN